MEIVFGIREGDHIRFEVLGPTCPQAEEDWYRAQLNAEIHINVGTFRGYRSLVMFSDDFHVFRAALKRLLSGETVGAALETGDFLAVDVSADGSSYNVWMQLDALERGSPPELPELELQYGDYARWQEALLASEAVADERRYWRQQMAELAPLDVAATRKPPWYCAGAMKCGVPSPCAGRDRSAPSSKSFASPKSASLATPSARTRMLSGFTSRWMTRPAWA